MANGQETLDEAKATQFRTDHPQAARGGDDGSHRGGGQTIAQICQKLEISEQTLYRWRQQFRGMGDDQIRRLKELEEENRRLKKAVADLVLDKQIIEEVLKGKY